MTRSGLVSQSNAPHLRQRGLVGPLADGEREVQVTPISGNVFGPPSPGPSDRSLYHPLRPAMEKIIIHISNLINMI